MAINKATELPRIKDVLKVPIEDVQFDEARGVVQIKSVGKWVGEIGFIKTSSEIIYQTDPKYVYNMDWEWIYRKHQSEIDSKVYDEIDHTPIYILIGQWAQLYIHEKERGEVQGDLLLHVRCEYEENEWQITILTDNR